MLLCDWNARRQARQPRRLDGVCVVAADERGQPVEYIEALHVSTLTVATPCR